MDRCFWCDSEIHFGRHTDHVVPRRAGGPDEPWNLVTACQPCNLAKSSKMPVRWARAHLRKHLAEMERRFAKGVDGPPMMVTFPFWRPEPAWDKFVEGRVLRAIDAEGRFRVWAAEHRDPVALKTIAASNSALYDQSYVNQYPLMVQELDLQRAELDYFRHRVMHLEQELAFAYSLAKTRVG